ncbi:MAG TPA: hypothetical protein VJN70_01685 [Gemmatimonadaceae bacterium]|nr:hypothetical protein [Gemmatimonadaceae bacterium]
MTAYLTSPLRVAWHRAMSVVMALLLAATPLRAQTAAKALSLAEVIDLHQHGVSSRQILRNARAYCINFSMEDDSIRRQLTGAGSDTLLVGGLTNVCTTAKPAEKPPLPPLIDDEFAQSNTSQGFVWSNPRCRARFENEGVRMENTASDAMCMVRYPSLDLPADVQLDLEVSQLASTKHGAVILGFGRQDRSGKYYSLSVSADRGVELCWNSDRQCNSLVKLSEVSAVQTDVGATNHVAVEVRGQDIALLINGKRVGSYTADALVGGRLMVGVGPQTSVVLIRLTATPLR